MFTPYLPVSNDIIDVVCRPFVMCPIWHYGIETNSRLIYNSDALQTLRRRLGVGTNEKSLADVKVAFCDAVDKIMVYDERERDWLCVPSTDLPYTVGLTLQIHKMVMKHLRSAYKYSKAAEVRMRARQDILAQVAALRASTKLKERKRGTKISEKGSAESMRTQPDVAPAPIDADSSSNGVNRSNNAAPFEPNDNASTPSERVRIKFETMKPTQTPKGNP